ncbi:T9SS type A sorting domain-containing protein [Candidatus Neomarinimicrobiota bacterium]
MRLRKAGMLLVLVWLPISITQGNPIIPITISELQVTDEGWTIELHSWLPGEYLTGWYLTSLTDTAFFKDSIRFDSEYLVITPDSLKSSFQPNPQADELRLFDPQDGVFSDLYYGNNHPRMPVAPRSTQSISYSDWCYYLDNTPTLGFSNDSAGAMSYVHGLVTDTLGYPLAEVQVIDTGYRDTTDREGHFQRYTLAANRMYYFRKDNYHDHMVFIMAYPDSSVYDTVEIKEVVHAIREFRDPSPRTIQLSANYPNPFNSTTEFTYALPWDTPVEIAVYNLRGRMVDRLYQGDQRAGVYRMQWVTHDLPSGVYIYQLRSLSGVLNRKCVLLK